MPKPQPLILLVEDEPDVRAVLAEIVEAGGFRIETASNYTDAVMLLEASSPALLITDVAIPDGGDGHKLAELARRLGVPTLLVSGYPEVILEDEAKGIPFLAKPFSMAELQQAIRTLIEGPLAATDLGPTKPNLP